MLNIKDVNQTSVLPEFCVSLKTEVDSVKPILNKPRLQTAVSRSVQLSQNYEVLYLGYVIQFYRFLVLT